MFYGRFGGTSEHASFARLELNMSRSLKSLIVIPKEGEELMENPAPSRTAVATATHRAAHYIFDGAPKILADPFARDLAGFSTDEEIRTALDAFAFPDPSRLRTAFAVRSRYAED